MKKLILTALLGTFVTINAEQIRVDDILDGYMAAWNRHDIKAIDSFYADNVIWYDLSYDYTTKGKKSVTKAITDAFLGSVKDMYWGKSGDTFISGNTIIYEWVYGGIFNGEYEGKVIQNRKFEIKGISTTTVDENGKIVSQKDYYDALSLKRALN